MENLYSKVSDVEMVMFLFFGCVKELGSVCKIKINCEF